MDIEKLRQEFDKFLEEKNFDYSDPDVVKKGLELERLIFDKSDT